MRVTVKGQVTIPQAIRAHLGISPHSEVDFVLHGSQVLLVAKGDTARASRFARVVGILGKKWTTDGIMKMTRE